MLLRRRLAINLRGTLCVYCVVLGWKEVDREEEAAMYTKPHCAMVSAMLRKVYIVVEM